MGEGEGLTGLTGFRSVVGAGKKVPAAQLGQYIFRSKVVLGGPILHHCLACGRREFNINLELLDDNPAAISGDSEAASWVTVGSGDTRLGRLLCAAEVEDQIYISNDALLGLCEDWP